MIQDEKTKQLSTSEKKSLRFVEKIETIDPIKQLPAIPIQTEVFIKILLNNIFDFS